MSSHIKYRVRLPDGSYEHRTSKNKFTHAVYRDNRIGGVGPTGLCMCGSEKAAVKNATKVWWSVDEKTVILPVEIIA